MMLEDTVLPGTVNNSVDGLNNHMAVVCAVTQNKGYASTQCLCSGDHP